MFLILAGGFIGLYAESTILDHYLFDQLYWR